MVAPFLSIKRWWLVCTTVALTAAGCTAASPRISITPTAPSDSIRGVARGAIPISLLQAQSELTVGKNLFSFGLVTGSGQLIQGGTPEVYAARDTTSKALGPFRATFYRFTAAQRHSPTSRVRPSSS